MCLPRRVLSILLLAALGGPAAAQWAPTPYVAGNPLFIEGFHVTHDDGLGIRAFSAAARVWTTIAGSGAAVQGTGDWTVLVDDPDGWIAYSARRNSTRLLAVQGAVLHVAVDDDVILLVELPAAGPPLAHGYSAVTNAWSTVPLFNVPTPADIAISRFVIGIRDEVQYLGFAARTGAWSALPVQDPGGPPMADGNVLLADLTDPLTGLGTPDVAAFSGVRGNWDVSPPYSTGSPILLDHNVAYVRADAGDPLFAAAGYSAYEGLWFVSGVVRNVTPTLIEWMTDNVIVLDEQSDEAIRFEGFGSEPANWALITGNLVPVSMDQSYAIVSDVADQTMWGFSGECMGTWVPQAINGPPWTHGSVLGGDHDALIQVIDTLYAFSPARSAWSPPMVISINAVVTNQDALSDVRDATFMGTSTRRGGWSVGPAVPPQAFFTMSAGSVVVHQQQTGPGTGDIYIFDERSDRWPGPFNPGGVSLLTLGRNVVISNLAGAIVPIHGYSVQRGNWTSPAGFVAPVGVPPVAEENVAYVVDSNSMLWAFGAPNDGHVYHAWPNGTEYHTSGVAEYGNTPFFAYGVQGNPGDLVWVAGSVNRIQPPLVIPGIGGALCLDPFLIFSLGFWGAVDLDYLLEQMLFVFTPLPSCVEIWFQPLILDAATLQVRFGHRCDPAWFF